MARTKTPDPFAFPGAVMNTSILGAYAAPKLTVTVLNPPSQYSNGTLSIPSGQSVTLTFRATADGKQVKNPNLKFSSLDGFVSNASQNTNGDWEVKFSGINPSSQTFKVTDITDPINEVVAKEITVKNK